jgi:Fe-S cluster biosynthesis and repair protein YggX
MTRLVLCRKYGKELEGLDAPPLPGKRGEEIYNTVSKRAWAEWQHHQTMLINEKHLSMVDPQARKYLAEQMEKFFSNSDVETAEGYVAPKAP